MGNRTVLAKQGEQVRERIIETIKSYIQEHSYPPTVREIGEIVGLKSTSCVQSHMMRLFEEGRLETDAASSPRAIRIPGYELLSEYKAIGTVEECKEAKEKQTPKKPNIWGDGYDDKGNMIYDTYDCPNCGKSYELDYQEYKYCPECGQAIDWSEDTE